MARQKDYLMIWAHQTAGADRPITTGNFGVADSKLKPFIIILEQLTKSPVTYNLPSLLSIPSFIILFLRLIGELERLAKARQLLRLDE